MENPINILFIKLGSNGKFEKECIEHNSSIKLGYNEIEFQKCNSGDWDQVLTDIEEAYGTWKSATTSHRNQIRKFFDEPKETMWITFYQSKLWYCYADEEVLLNADGTKERKTLSRWKDCDSNGSTLFIQALSGRLTKVQGFRGTICDVKEKEYLLHKINNTQSSELQAVEKDLTSLKLSLSKLVKKLNPKDFEVFIDLIFRTAGWSRVGTLGKTTKDIDIELLAPVTNERAVVQIKSQSNLKTYLEYKNRLSGFEQDYEKIFFVTHTPNQELSRYRNDHSDEDILFYDCDKLAELCINSGLIEWLISVAP